MISLSEILKKRKVIIEKGMKKFPGENRCITEKDCKNLYNLVKDEGFERALEIGSWYGVSAMVLHSCGMRVYTCDRHNAFVYNEIGIKYYNGWSTTYLKRLCLRGLKFDMLFLDGRIMVKDIKYLKKLLKPGALVVTHDYEEGAKGDRNFKFMRKYLCNINVIEGMGVSKIK